MAPAFFASSADGVEQVLISFSDSTMSHGAYCVALHCGFSPKNQESSQAQALLVARVMQ